MPGRTGLFVALLRRGPRRDSSILSCSIRDPAHLGGEGKEGVWGSIGRRRADVEEQKAKTRRGKIKQS